MEIVDIKYKKTWAVLGGLVILVGLLTGIALRTKEQVKEMFRLNKELQEENYYMAEFEFKMLGLSYLLDKGHYYTALKKLNELHHQMKTREGIVKMPEFKTKEAELEFYLSLQNPKTGAFMDDSYPLNTYYETTENVLLHLDALAEETGQPLKLKYPLYFLDNFNTKEKLIPILEDWSTVGWIALQFPQTSFHNVRDLISLARDYEHHNEDEVSMIQKHNLYNFSPEWKHALLEWVYNYQDPETGLWGPKSESGKLVKMDISNTAPILKTFVDSEGNNIYEEFPLKYKDELFQSVLAELDKETPEDKEDLDEWHEWGLETPKGLRTLTRYLWKDASAENKQNAKKLIEKYINVKFEKFYIPEEGAFSYYPFEKDATLDGTSSGLDSLEEFGALSSEKQTKLWGSPKENIIDKGIIKTLEFSEKDFDWVKGSEINSLRVYRSTPDYGNLNSNIYGVLYPKETKVLDAIDLIPKVKKWTNATDQTMGNWVSKEGLIKQLEDFQTEKVPVYNGIPLDISNKNLNENKRITLIGFDILQIPRFKIILELKK